jgi:hypothetical protein
MKFVQPGQHDGIRQTGLFAITAIDAFEKIDFVTFRAAVAVFPLFRLDGDSGGGTGGFTQLAGDAAFFTVWISPKRMQPPETHRLRGLLLRILNGELGGKKTPTGYPETAKRLQQ